MRNYSFTIFTPCYNGARTIKRVFDSVFSQTYENYQWIIINDGSSDDSDTVIRSYIKQYNKIADKILYLSQENLGKHKSWNRALEYATGDFFLPADCDDSFIPTTLQFFNEKANEIAGDSFISSVYSGINVCCYDPQTDNIIGVPYPYDNLVSNNIELNYKYHIKGEHWGCIRSDLLKKLPFPAINGHFYNENYLWYSLAKEYSVVCYNKLLRAYYFESNSLVHNEQYFYDEDRAKMWFNFRIWQLRNVGYLIFRYSKKGGFKMLYETVRSIIKISYLKLYYIFHKN